MSLVPRTVAAKIAFFRIRLSKWAEAAEQIGSTPEEIASLEERVAEAHAAFEAQRLAQARAQAATGRLRAALARMSTEGSAVITRARARAQVTKDHRVYELALIDAPAKGSPLGAPGTPDRFQVQLEQNGMLGLSWDCDNPSGAAGTVYEIFRSDSGYDGPFTYLGNTGVRKFVDAKIPAGVTRVTYKIRAVRSTKVGSSAYFSVSFGGVGIAVARTVPNAPRLAA